MTAPRWSYDLIADVYATDMGASMPFDDVGWYAARAAESSGRVLELGCGTGRVLVELAARGADVTGVDRSLPMLARLRRDAAARGLDPAVAQMDLRALALRGTFALVLAPYSLITYLTEPDDVDAFIDAARALLTPAGRLAIDAFVPRDVASYDDFRFDYRRPHGELELERHKRIAALPDGTNRIERRYRLLREGTELETFTTLERIRPWRPDQLRALLARHGLSIVAEAWDYAAAAQNADSRFYTLLAAR